MPLSLDGKGGGGDGMATRAWWHVGGRQIKSRLCHRPAGTPGATSITSLCDWFLIQKLE